MSNVFERYAPFIQDFIYKNNWEELRAVQVEAARVIFDTDNNLLLTSSTASGKTEAAFFPVLTDIYENSPSSFGVLYISPLKSLINDQFARIDELLDMSGIPVFHWHGDVSASHKTKALKNPCGILQITPESLESMLMNRSNDILRLFHDLRYVIIDEIRTLMGTDRGNQIICQLSRLQNLIGNSPRRIGLSATIGDPKIAAEWLGSGSGRDTEMPEIPSEKLKWRIGMEHFYIQNENTNQTVIESENTEPKALFDAGYEYIYESVKNKKSLVFSNSREETEYVTSTLRQIAETKREEDIFTIHHGNLSASLREEAEMKLKDDDCHTVTCATVTLELGIDIGKLERIVQNNSPNSVSSFLQRLGRSGRRGTPPEMLMVFREENPLPNAPLPQLIPWELIKGIAIIQLYLEERFIEPPKVKKMPFSLLFQQTLSILNASGELSPKRLAEKVLSLPPFINVSKEDYKTLLLSMLQNGFIQQTEERGLIVGLEGEKITNSFKFYATFKDSEDFTVRCQSDEIGTITCPPPVGDRFALAGKVWEVEELDMPRRLVYVKKVNGKMEISWPGEYGEIHTKILERMKKVLEEDTIYPYLKPNALSRLQAARNVAQNTGILKNSLVHLGGYTWCLFPWLGTKAIRTLRKYIAQHASQFKISNIESEVYYIMFKMETNDPKAFIDTLDHNAKVHGIDTFELVGTTENPVFDKYDSYIPGELLRKAYAKDRLCAEEVCIRLDQIAKE